MADEQLAAPATQVLQMARGYMVSQVVYVAARLGLADLIAAGVGDTEGLASASGTDPDALHRVLRVLADVGLVARDGGGGYRLTPTGECLRSDDPGSVRHMVIHLGEEHYRAWSELLYSVRTGQPAMERVLGQPVFAYLASHPEAADTFNRGMAELVRDLILPALSALDFSRSTTVADVGGGNGSLLRHLLQAHSHLRGILIDRPDVVASAVPELRTGALADRCDLAGGDFFKEVPAGADTYLLSRVVHDFDDRQAARLLAKVRAAVPPAGRLIILERVLPDDDTPHPGKIMDLNMLVANGGRERTAAEFARLLDGSGFRLDRIIPTSGALQVVAGLPA